MLKKRSSWYKEAFKALLFCGVLYRFSQKFMRGAEKAALPKRKQQKKDDRIDELHRLLVALRKKK